MLNINNILYIPIKDLEDANVNTLVDDWYQLITTNKCAVYVFVRMLLRSMKTRNSVSDNFPKWVAG